MDFSHLYYKAGGPASFSSLNRLYKHAKKENKNVKRKDVKEYLEKQYTFSRHKRLRKTFPRRKCLFLRIDEVWAGDLIQVDTLSSYNSGYNYILNVIDCFSRKLWARALKKKTPQEVELGLRSIIQENNNVSPYLWWTDSGKEFTQVKTLYEEQEMTQYSTKSPLKSMIIERANASLENHLYKNMTSLQTARWTNLLQDAVSAINERSSVPLHGLSPNEAHKKENERWLRQKFLDDYKKHKRRFEKQPAAFSIGDTVRLVHDQRETFHRGYQPSTQIDPRTIVNVLHTYPKTYKVSGKNRAYYAQELVKINPQISPKELEYFIERTRKVNTKIHRSGKVTGGDTQYLLKSKNNSEQSSWISEQEYQKLKDGGLIK